MVRSATKIFKVPEVT